MTTPTPDRDRNRSSHALPQWEIPRRGRRALDERVRAVRGWLFTGGLGGTLLFSLLAGYHTEVVSAVSAATTAGTTATATTSQTASTAFFDNQSSAATSTATTTTSASTARSASTSARAQSSATTSTTTRSS